MKPISIRPFGIRAIVYFVLLGTLSAELAWVNQPILYKQNLELEELSNYLTSESRIFNIIWIIALIVIMIFFVRDTIRVLVTIKSENQPGSVLRTK